jgi:hypothetical protein
LRCIGIVVVSFVPPGPATSGADDASDARAQLDGRSRRAARGAITLRGRARRGRSPAGLLLARLARGEACSSLLLGDAVAATRPRACSPPLLLRWRCLHPLSAHHFRFPPLFEWPTLSYARPLGWLAVVLLAADVVAERFAAPPDAHDG